MTNPLTITTTSPIPRGGTLLITVTSSEPAIRRVTIWMFAPGVVPNPTTGNTWLDIKRHRRWAKSMHPLGTAKKLIPQRWPSGVYSVVCHVPNEPGSAFGDLIQVATVEVS